MGGQKDGNQSDRDKSTRIKLDPKYYKTICSTIPGTLHKSNDIRVRGIL